MKLLLKLFAYLFVMLALLIFFMPKTNLYYAAEELMQKENLYISDELVNDTGFSLELDEGNILFDKLTLAKIDRIRLSPWVFYNTLTFRNIHVNEGFSDFLPAEIERVDIWHAFYNPAKVILEGESAESHFFGEVDLLERVVTIHLRLDAKSEKRYKNILKRLTKEEGGYLYEYKF